VWLTLALLVGTALGRDLYSYVAPDGTAVLTDSPDHAGFERWWSDPEPGAYLPNGVPMPRLDRIRNLDIYDGWFLESAAEVGVPAELLKAVAVAESGMNAGAVSRVGAKGLMQMMPATGMAMGVRDLFDPHESIRGGAAYLARQVGRFGSYPHALAAYNAGPAAVQKYGGIPPYDETRTYVARVMGLYEHFRDNRRVAR
jgi:soluble lytic murein transglycosylase-like protein